MTFCPAAISPAHIAPPKYAPRRQEHRCGIQHKHYSKRYRLTGVIVYAKLFTSIYQGTLRGNSHGLLVFTNLLAHCDKAGEVDIHPRAIAEEVGLTIEQVKAALTVLESPDDESRSPEEQGRRITRLDEHRAWGWRVVNYVKYRAIRSEDDRREQNRASQERWRKAHKQSKPPSAAVSQDQPQSAHTEAEAEADTEKTEVREDACARAVSGHAPTKAGEACIAIRKAGIAAVNPGHPDLVRLLAAGVTPQELGDTAAELVQRNKGKFALLLATVEGRLRDAAAAGAVPAAPPAKRIHDTAEQTAEYLRKQELTPEQRAAADAARRRVMASIKRAAA